MSNIKVLCDRDDLVAIADSVRYKTGDTGELTLGEIKAGVDWIPSTSVIEPLEITKNGTYTAPYNIDGYNPISKHKNEKHNSGHSHRDN